MIIRLLFSASTSRSGFFRGGVWRRRHQIAGIELLNDLLRGSNQLFVLFLDFSFLDKNS